MADRTAEWGLSGEPSRPPQQRRVGSAAFVQTLLVETLISACTIVQGIIVARALGPSGRGELAAAILWPTSIAEIGRLGTHLSLARRAATSADLHSLARSGIAVSALTSSVATVVCYFALPSLIPNDDPTVLAAARFYTLLIPVTHLSVNLRSIDQGAGFFKRSNATSIGLNAMYLLCLVVLWLFGHASVFSFVAALLFANGVIALLRVCVSLQGTKLFGRVLSLWTLLRDSRGYAVSEVVRELGLQVDKIFILWLLSPRDLGLYAVALSAGGSIASLATSTEKVAFSLTAQAGRGVGFDQVASVFRMIVVLWLICGTILGLSLPALLPFVYGADYAGSIVLAEILILGFAFAGLGSILDHALRGQGNPLAGVVSRCWSIAVFVPLAYGMVVEFGSTGVAISFVVAQLVSLTVMASNARSHYDGATLGALVPRRSDLSVLRAFVRRQRLAARG